MQIFKDKLALLGFILAANQLAEKETWFWLGVSVVLGIMYLVEIGPRPHLANTDAASRPAREA